MQPQLNYDKYRLFNDRIKVSKSPTIALRYKSLVFIYKRTNTIFKRIIQYYNTPVVLKLLKLIPKKSKPSFK